MICQATTTDHGGVLRLNKANVICNVCLQQPQKSVDYLEPQRGHEFLVEVVMASMFVTQFKRWILVVEKDLSSCLVPVLRSFFILCL